MPDSFDGCGSLCGSIAFQISRHWWPSTCLEVTPSASLLIRERDVLSRYRHEKTDDYELFYRNSRIEI